MAALIATMVVWSAWLGWFVFVNGHHDVEWGGPWGTFRFGMLIALKVALILCGVFLLVNLIFPFFIPRIPWQRRLLSSLTLALTSLILWPALPDGGAPLAGLMLGLPIVAALWMVGGRGSRGTTDLGQSPAPQGNQGAGTHL
jgi:hypothetical protein